MSLFKKVKKAASNVIPSPIETTGQAPGGIGNIVLPFLCLIMLFQSINKSKK